jgi:cobalt/nickel transport protein
MATRGRALLIGLLLAASASLALAHFQTLLPATDVVTSEGPRSMDLRLIFTHPMEQGPVMEMGPPRRFGVLVAGEEKQDLLATVEEQTLAGKTAYSASYRFAQPGDHVFYLEPAPYWEPAEEKMIIHYTKTVVNAFGDETGWDALVGLPVEIEPLTRPYGLWTGNLFRGIVRAEGQPVPFAEVEVEYWNEGSEVAIPAAPYVTQVIKADANGVFSYALPRAGWWSFAALVDGPERMENPEGETVDVELGGLLWVRCRDME